MKNLKLEIHVEFLQVLKKRKSFSGRKSGYVSDRQTLLPIHTPIFDKRRGSTIYPLEQITPLSPIHFLLNTTYFVILKCSNLVWRSLQWVYSQQYAYMIV